MLKRLNRKWQIVFLLTIVVVLGLLSKQYTGIGQQWINDYSGDILYEVFWCLFIFLLVPSRQIVDKIPLGVFIVTCIIEFSQLWRSPFLEWIRSYFLGRLLLGTTFAWNDFIHYAIGCIIGWFLLRRVLRV